MFEISAGTDGPRTVHSGERLAGVRHRSAGCPGKIDIREAGRKILEPGLKRGPAGRSEEDSPVGKHHLQFHAGLRTPQRDHHPVTMKFKFIGPLVDPRNVGRFQEFH